MVPAISPPMESKARILREMFIDLSDEVYKETRACDTGEYVDSSLMTVSSSLKPMLRGANDD